MNRKYKFGAANVVDKKNMINFMMPQINGFNQKFKGTSQRIEDQKFGQYNLQKDPFLLTKLNNSVDLLCQQGNELQTQPKFSNPL